MNFSPILNTFTFSVQVFIKILFYAIDDMSFYRGHSRLQIRLNDILTYLSK